MHTYKWDKKFEVGYKVIDNQHKQLLASINRLIINQLEDKEMLVAMLEEVIKYAEYHFTCEYNLMRLSKYPQAEAHLREHSTLLKQLKNHQSRTSANRENIEHTLIFIVKWFIHHTIRDDREFAAHLRQTLPQLEGEDVFCA